MNCKRSATLVGSSAFAWTRKQLTMVSYCTVGKIRVRVCTSYNDRLPEFL